MVQYFNILCYNDDQLIAMIGLLITLIKIPGVEIADADHRAIPVF